MMSKEILSLLLQLETLGNIKIQNAIVGIDGNRDSLTFTNQANENFTFELQNIDVENLVSKISGSANQYSDVNTTNLKNQIEQSLTALYNNNSNSIKSVNAKIVSDIEVLSEATNKQIRAVDTKFANYTTKVNVTKQIDSIDKSINLKLNTIDTNIIKLKEKDESIAIELDELRNFIENINNLDFVQDVKFEGNYAYVTKDGETKKYLLPVGKGGVILGGGGGGGSEFKYTNDLPTPQRVGGVPKGSTFNNATEKTMWNLLLYGEDDPYFSTFNIDYKLLYEVGEPIIHQNKTAYWGINNTKLLSPNSIKIKYVNEDIVIAEDLPNTGSYTFISPEIVFNEPTKVDFMILAKSTTQNNLQDVFSFYYKHRIYVGSNELELLDSDDIKSLQLTDLVDTIDGKYPVGEEGYKWVCYPVFFGLKRSFKDFETDIDIEMEDVIIVNVTNIYNIDIEYYCHRSFYKLGSAMEIVVN